MKNIIELIKKYMILKDIISTYDKNPQAGIYFAKKYIGLSADIVEKLDIAEKVPRLREESYKLIKDELLLYLDEVVKDISDNVNKDSFIGCLKEIYSIEFKTTKKNTEDESMLDDYFKEHNDISKEDYIKYFNIGYQSFSLIHSKLNYIEEIIKQIDKLDESETSKDILNMLFKLEKSYLDKYTLSVIEDMSKITDTLVYLYGDKLDYINDSYSEINEKLVEYDGIKYDILLIEVGFLIDIINNMCKDKDMIIKALQVRNDIMDIINSI